MDKKKYSGLILSCFSWLHRFFVDFKSTGGKFFESQYLKEPEDAYKDALTPVNPHYDC